MFIDTTGWAFCYPLAWLAGSRVAAYVHYPTISSDMLRRVWRGTATYNNNADIAGAMPRGRAGGRGGADGAPNAGRGHVKGTRAAGGRLRTHAPTWRVRA